MPNTLPVIIFWFRRDLRLSDNAGLYHALKIGIPVVPLFIFDEDILSKLDDKTDKRVSFIYDVIYNINKTLSKMGSSLMVRYGRPLEIWKLLLEEYSVSSVYANHDYEPYARTRDRLIYDFLANNGIKLNTFKDQVVFEYKEILKNDNEPYTVYTPYSKKWKSKLNAFYIKPYPTETYHQNFIKCEYNEVINIGLLGFCNVKSVPIDPNVSVDTIKGYANDRDYPELYGTSRLSVHLRFGTVSIRRLASVAIANSEKWLNELIWREFYMMILWHFPYVVDKSFKPAYDNIIWVNNEIHFEAWKNGRTGYPLVDAGMRELNETGFMHNRVRMVTASFLTKHLLIDWRWGESYFAKKLLDFELASNNGGWQWAAGTGCDASPYFRVFNPAIQMEKYDKNMGYVKKWVPGFNDPFVYPKPIVDHNMARNRALMVYKAALDK